ncbi:AurF N-oxygenase family protein [Mycolicibacterium brumae]|uniref:Diiron oxygenase n=1 Tax=Mycolicibacterium brumae TaxID=85968 RepID=A0A2G5PF13_9MYCO|nr:diiron oxygenase [Mycolicibacterium brumae]MCV7191610.1 diiron oxygenase [Mycolicibacterium brumae]PIB76912.1 diiron oxygenase [Mycolicibacterium brumae]RWA20536.1 hypothetical protein MBRU_02440 [Mycolicibacterium brumae DSM 44177]UWW07632.1 diiron oxygenase [Mycolicibacterium brumae]
MTRALENPNSTRARSREEVAQRLLKGSVRKSYAPVVDIDWEAPVEPDVFFLPPQMLSLYGTEQWDNMSREQQIELSRQELVNVLSAGIWFENILNQALLRDLMHRNPTAASSHYKLTELGDETRHMVMFGKAIDWAGGIPVRPRLWQRIIINALPFLFRGPVLWGAALVGEEIFDALQRDILENGDAQPIVLRLMRIHVTEEARHIQFARDDLRKTAPTMPWYRKMLVANLHGVGGPFYRYLFTNPAIYARAGLDPREARRAALANPNFRRSCKEGAAPLTDFFTEVGLMGRLSRRMWRRAGFL